MPSSRLRRPGGKAEKRRGNEVVQRIRFVTHWFRETSWWRFRMCDAAMRCRKIIGSDVNGLKLSMSRVWWRWLGLELAPLLAAVSNMWEWPAPGAGLIIVVVGSESCYLVFLILGIGGDLFRDSGMLDLWAGWSDVGAGLAWGRFVGLRFAIFQDGSSASSATSVWRDWHGCKALVVRDVTISSFRLGMLHKVHVL